MDDRERDARNDVPPEAEGTEGPAAEDPPFEFDLDSLTEEDVRELLEKAGLAEEYLEKLQFARAEFQNYRKRLEKEKADWTRFGIQNLVLDILPALESLEKALEAPADGADAGGFLEGFRMVLQMLSDTLARHGVKPIDAMGKTFDPCFHEAQGFLDAPDGEENTVAAEISRGYQLHDRVIRPSKVLVARKPQPPPDADEDGAEDDG